MRLSSCQFWEVILLIASKALQNKDFGENGNSTRQGRQTLLGTVVAEALPVVVLQSLSKGNFNIFVQGTKRYHGQDAHEYIIEAELYITHTS